MRIRQKNTYGLALQANSLTVPDGGVERLVNVLLQRDNVYVKERGFLPIYDPAGTIYGIFEFDQFIVVIFNSTVIRIDKTGTEQGTATASNEPFEIDGTLRPAPNAFAFAPFSLVTQNRALFCTPEGVRVLRSSASNVSQLTGVDQPLVVSSGIITTTGTNFIVGQGIVTISTGAAGDNISRVFYSNDLLLTAAIKTSGAVEGHDVDADRAISYRAVLRRVFSDGTFIESTPSPPVFAYNSMFKNVQWTTVGAANPWVLNIGVNFTGLTLNRLYTGKIRNAYAQPTGIAGPIVDQPQMSGTWTFKIISTSPGVLEVDVGQIPLESVNTPPFENSGYLDFQLDRYSTINVYAPSSAQAGDFIDLYASRSEIDLTDAPNAVPDGDYYLVSENILTTPGSGAFPSAPGYFFQSEQKDFFQKGIPLYTNPSDGDLSRQPNTKPPGANSIEEWKGCTFYGNTYGYHSVELTHIGTNYSIDANIRIQFVDSGTPEEFLFPALTGNVDASVIKARTILFCLYVTFISPNFYAYYSQNNIDFPGGFTIVSRVPNRGFKVFTVNTPLANATEPVLGQFFASTPVSSSQEVGRNRIWWSKLNQPEAVPFFVDVGAKEEDILRIMRTRESLIVVKRDGIFSLFGDPSSGSLTVREIDTTIKGISSTGAARLGNRVFAKTNQGIVAISETSLSLVSRGQIEPVIKVSDESSVQSTVMYALEDDRQLYIATAKNPSDTSRIVYSYNSLTQTWSELSRVFTWGFVIDNNFTALKNYQNNRVITDGNKVYLERKDYLQTDWAGDESSDSVSAKLGDTVTLGSSYVVGSQLAWDNGSAIKLFRVTSVAGNVHTLNIPFTGTPPAFVLVYSPIESIIRTSPVDGGDSSITKQFTTFDINTRYDAISECTLSFRSDWFEYGTEVLWSKQTERRGWGMEQWGRFPWGQSTLAALEYLTAPSQIIQTEVPNPLQKSTFLQAEITHNVACEGMFIQQMAFNVRTSSERPAR